MKKLENSWTSDKIVRDLSTEFLENIRLNFNEIEDDIKCKVLLSLLLVKSKQASQDNFKKSCYHLLKMAINHHIEWVKVTAELVLRKLPSYLIYDEISLKSSEIEKSSQEIEIFIKSVSSENNQIPISFLPFENQIKFDEKIMKEINIDKICKNYHFQVKEEEEINELDLNLNFKKENSKTKILKSKLNEKEIQKRLEKLGNRKNSNQHQHQSNGSSGNKNLSLNKKNVATGSSLLVTENQRKVLTELLNSTNINTESKEIIKKYLNGSKMNKIETLIIAENSSKLGDNYLKVEQTKLRIDFKNRQIKKVKAVKRYKMSK